MPSALMGRAFHNFPTLCGLEHEREERWRAQSSAAELKLGWRALFAKNFLHIVPGETILEFGAGGGALTAQLSGVLRGENPVVSVVFSEDLLAAARSRKLPKTSFVAFGDLGNDCQFDYVIGAGTLWHAAFDEVIGVVYDLLKPGGQMLFFEPNPGFPARVLNGLARSPRRNTFARDPHEAEKALARNGFTDVETAPHDIVSCRLGYAAMRRLQAKAILVEHMPVLRSACASMYVTGRRPGTRVKALPNLAEHPVLRDAVSVVVPAHNEAANLPQLVSGLLAYYGDYIHEVIIVNDSSTDATAAIANRLAQSDPRIRLIHRGMPNGVGRALKDGYRAATGKYILSMDCDFQEILPELRVLFDAVAGGHAGAIGSRFSHESLLVNYPIVKMILNRLCHLIIRLFLFDHIRDITNNLKLYRADILKTLDIESPHFSANLETGLKPLLAGHDITEVAISWINRTPQMGSSSFALRKVGADYARTLYRCWRNEKRARGAVQLLLTQALARLSHAVKH